MNKIYVNQKNQLKIIETGYYRNLSTYFLIFFRKPKKYLYFKYSLDMV